MHPQSTINDDSANLPYPLPVELVLAGRYVGAIEHLRSLPDVVVTERAWAAGFFDGEGCTYLGHHSLRRFPVPTVAVSQVEGSVLIRLRAAVGAVGYTRHRPSRSHPKHAEIWEYRTSNWRDTQSVLTIMWPYLSAPKRDQATCVFRAYQARVDDNPLLGRPSTQALWTDTTCPYGHTDVYVRIDRRGHRIRRCRTCRRARQSSPYRDLEGASQQAFGEGNGQATLTADTVQYIRQRYSSGEKQNALALEYGVPKQTINNIVLRYSWRHIVDDSPVLPPHAGNCTLTEAQVREIRLLHAQGQTNAALAARYGVGPSAISKIVHRKKWRHLDD